ncbi:ankyrin repeat domain-containing protein [Luteimonas sp. 50]|uniref:Ankyrin repeat domain-containing protein n=2 Tax=Cognatiluteimonas sedimenti TaxID=2927791 RepID=A0ABT0A661_9GAMM|nr:ankyrin repeat domain-containing protein [Lysobacter sedimenti]MCJ0826446.1 ankyrin repeat domain-containing protein [Lysobacter sedimenti]
MLPLAALGTGALFAAIAGLGGIAAALGATLAQPAFALALARWGGPATEGGVRRALQQQALALLVLWGLAALTLALVLAWPLSALLDSGSLAATLALSLVIGLAWLVLWRLWPLWRGVEGEGGSLPRHWQALALLDPGAWRGLGVAAIVLVLAAMPTVLAWPGLLGEATRWGLAAALAVASPLLHWLLQRTAPAAALAQHGFDPGDQVVDDTAAPPDGEPLDAALYAAARSGRVDRALALLEAGANPHAPPPDAERDQRTLPVLAAVLPDLRLLRALIGHGIDLNAAHAGMTPLLAATRDSWHGRPEAVMTLLANGADPRAADLGGNTPLHHAARSSDPGVAALLRDAAADLEARNHDGLTPLGIACACGNWRLARFLLERGASAQSDGGTPALLAAASGEEDDAAGVQLLLKHKARVDARDAHGRSALHEAAFAGHVEIIAALLAAHADLQARDDHGRTPLLDAARGARLPALEALAAAGADIGVLDGDGRGALALACVADASVPELVQRLLELGADPEPVDRHGRRAIEHAAQAGRWALVAALDPAYPLPAAVVEDAPAASPPDRAPQALLRDSLRGGRYEGLDNLVRLLPPAELGALLLDDELPPAPQRIEWLLAHGADADARDGLADNAMFALLARGAPALPALQVLLRRGVSPAGAGGLARFLGACAAGDQAARGLEQCALDLLERGADPFASSAAGDPPLALAIRLGWLRLVECLIVAGVDLDARDSHGMSALHLAAALGREAALKLLVMRGASPDMRAADGQTPLGVALSAGRRDLADWLDWRGWPLPRRALQASDVPAAAIVGDADAVRRLLDLGFGVDTVDAQGCTALLRAAGGGHRATVDLLLARGADPQRAAHTGATPLSAAVSMRHGEIVDGLLAAGAGLEQRLPGDVTVLMLAAALGLPDLCARLLQAGANVHAGDAQGLTPLHCAALFGFTAREKPRLVALLDTLLLAGAEADAIAAGDVTPVLLLLGARAEPGTACDEEVVLAGLERLLDEDVVLEVQDPRGFGPLHLAALHGLLRITQRLLRAGCDPDLRDTLNRSPREIAVMRGFVDVAGEYAPAIPGGVSMARFLREPR